MDSDLMIKIIVSNRDLLCRFLIVGRALYPEIIGRMIDEAIRVGEEKEEAISQADEREIIHKTDRDWVEHSIFFKQAVRQAHAILREAANGTTAGIDS